MHASHAIAKSIGKGPYFAQKIRSLTRYIGCFHTLPPATAGKHNAHPSLLNDEWIAQAVYRYLTVLADGEITPFKLLHHVNKIIIPSLGFDIGAEKISISCARHWLIKLGYAMKEVKKGAYVDGHECANVIEYCKKFLKEVEKNAHLRCIYRDEELEPIEPSLPPGEKLHIPVYHNESICHSNELWHQVWVREGRMPLRKKGEGCTIHILGFIIEQTGCIALNKEQLQLNNQLPPGQKLEFTDAREIMYPGKNSDGWWNMEKLIVQVKRMIPIFERMHPGTVGEFFFDQSSAHGAYAPDALNAKEMNLRPGGKQCSMHSTFIPMDNPNPTLRGMPQDMNFPMDLSSDDPNYKYCGKPKRMQQILVERGLLQILIAANKGKTPLAECNFCKGSRETQEWLMREAQAALDGQDELEGTTEDVMQPGSSITCCMRKYLSEQADFKAEKPLLQITIEAAGHKCHRAAADGTFPTAKRLVPEILDSCPVKTFHAFFRKTWRYMDAYRKGLNAKQAEFAVKKFCSHRAVGREVMMSLGIMENPA
ncbi:hypothetical protein M422DRAFT_270825 [Sphaerobolus stellatus SS14]|uniref:Uncharacterized protein n=1 Tax=Sphaerobolus stellatus (strain SS14) TaxID=990650 RepID=A0A0C9U1Q6_SPHS4|nr:hypothetical protein M422DRAFT_270825 [Sphaerobolus stellatus SS14]